MRPETVSSPQSPGAKSSAASIHAPRWRQKVLLVGGSESTQSLRASILRAHGLEVHVASYLAESHALYQRNTYDWVVLDTHSLFRGEVIDFCEQLKHAVPEQRIAFFVGPPSFISLKWPDEDVTEDTEESKSAA